MSPRLSTHGLVGAVATAGAVAAGVVLFEAALLPGLVIGAAAVLAPRLLPRRAPPKPAAGTTEAKRPGLPLSDILPNRLSDLTHIRLSQTVVKTITFRVIVTSLDFTANYVVLREPTTAAGLSAISLVGGPLLYFVHEGTWNYLAGTGRLAVGSPGAAATFLNNHPLAKTITYRTLASIIEFTTNYVVVRDLGTAALLSSVGFFLGPFIYYGHELAWERLATKNADTESVRGREATWREAVIIDVEPVAVSDPR